MTPKEISLENAVEDNVVFAESGKIFRGYIPSQKDHDNNGPWKKEAVHFSFANSNTVYRLQNEQKEQLGFSYSPIACIKHSQM